MIETVLFLSGVGLTAAVSALVLSHLRPHLQAILEDLCQTRDRAAFWTSFSMVMAGLAPVIFAMDHEPSDPRVPPVVEVARQLKWALAGLAGSVLLLGIVISRFIPRGPRAERTLPSATPESIGAPGH